MDLRLTNYDMDITNGDLSFVRGADAIAQHLLMRLRTFLEETPYDRSAGVPYLQVIFRRGTPLDSVRFVLETIANETPGVDDVSIPTLSLDPQTRALTASGTGVVEDEEIDFSIEIGGTGAPSANI